MKTVKKSKKKTHGHDHVAEVPISADGFAKEREMVISDIFSPSVLFIGCDRCKKNIPIFVGTGRFRIKGELSVMCLSCGNITKLEGEWGHNLQREVAVREHLRNGITADAVCKIRDIRTTFLFS
jgi:hypothetical protein